MKFIEKISHIGRTGLLCEFPLRWQGQAFKTPMCLTYTRAGSVPHLTYDVFEHLKTDGSLLLQTLPTIVDMKNAVKEYGSDLASFVGLADYPFHISVQDPAVRTPTGYNDKTVVSVWTDAGRKRLRVDEFMEVQKAFSPASYQALCDSDTPYDCSQKRLNHAVDRSLKLLDNCIKCHAESEELHNTAIFGTVQGGYDLYLRRKSAQQTAIRTVDGFIIDGFHVNGPDVQDIEFSKIKPVLEEIIQLLPLDKPRILHGAFKPNVILKAIRCGIDIFDSSYPYVITEKGAALVFPLSHSEYVKNSDLKPKLEIDVKDKIHAEDFSPILENCTCYSCCHFTKAYLHHLLVTAELLGKVLLMLHNMHHYMEFFKATRQAMENNSFEKFEQMLNNY